MKAELGQPLDDTKIERLISQEYIAGQDYVYGPDNIAAERDRNYDYLRGIMGDLPAPPSRSRVMELTVANYIGLMLPNLMRIFTAGRTMADYVSPKPELQDGVRLITRYINDVVFRKDNRGELLLNDWAIDGLVQKLGIAMWWWENRNEARDEVQEGLTDDQILLVGAQVAMNQVEVIEHSATDAPEGRRHAVKLRTWQNKSKCCIDVIPPEEFVISRDARTIEDAVLLAHRTGVMVGELVAEGYSLDELNKLPAYVDTYPDRMRKYNQAQIINDPSRASSADPMLRKVGVLRGILRCDRDGTGVKAWLVVAAGSQQAMKLLDMQPYNWQIGFADFCPEPMPHTVFGRCPADRLAAIQKIQTVMIRQINDNLFLSNTPQREVVMENILKPDQLMNFAPGNPVLVKAMNSIREMSVPFVADKAFGAMTYYDGQAELTSGVGRMSAGLDPGALANQSATASANQYSAMMGRVEMIARIWAQGGMRKLFRGVFNCVKAYQDFARVVQIDGAPQTIDPKTWEGLDDLDVNINTGLGTGNRERDYAVLQGIEATQTAIMEKLGANPIVDFPKLVRTLQLKAEAAGISYPENFFGQPKNPDGSPWVYQPPKPEASPDTIANGQALVAAEQVKANASQANNALKVASDERVEIYKAKLNAIVEAEKLGLDTAKVLLAAKRLELDEKIAANDRKPQAAE